MALDECRSEGETLTNLAEARLAVYASVGAELTHYEVNIADAALLKRGAIWLPEDIQYACQHRSRCYLYVTSSNGGSGRSGTVHHVTTLRIDPAGTKMSVATKWTNLDGYRDLLVKVLTRP